MRTSSSASATWAFSSIRDRWRPSAAARSEPTSCSCRRIDPIRTMVDHQPQPAGRQDDHRDQPRRDDGRGGRPGADRRHRHAAAPAPSLVRRAQPDRHLDGDRRQGDARGGDQADRHPEPGRADLRAGAARIRRSCCTPSAFARCWPTAAKLYDRIILDSPPTSAVTDPAVLGNLTDGVVLVVKAGETTRDAAMHARRQLAAAKAACSASSSTRSTSRTRLRLLLLLLPELLPVRLHVRRPARTPEKPAAEQA